MRRSLPLRPVARWLVAAVAAAALSCGAGGGAARHANRLVHESSPYLLLHAHDPVDWYPWGEAAFARARREGKPIFLSIGYSSCYWCHVMQREVFSQPAIAERMNRWFVSVAVDREEHPEIDEVYMTAARLLDAEGGGWPNNLFLTPDLAPFFSGTYFPPADRAGQPGFPTVLRKIHDAWTGRRQEVAATASRVAVVLRQTIAAQSAPAAALPDAAVVRRAVAGVAGRYDAEWGGFGGPPKFPEPAELSLLWSAGGAGEREMVVDTLRKMGRGAIYDQLDGGFHRYTLDREWRLPHFEKMLYDNALLAEQLAAAWQATRDPELARLARGTLDFLLARMALPQGVFAAALDAETDGVEGAYYTWTDAALRRALGADGYQDLAPLCGFDRTANLPDGRRTLFLTAAPDARIQRFDALRAARHARRPPRRDDKALADWNGMAIAALARAGQALGEPRYLGAAERAAGFVLARFRAPDGTLLHTWSAGAARVPAFLDDYAWLLRGLLALHSATGDERWLREALRLADEMERRLRDPRGGYFLSPPYEHLLFQPKTLEDGAYPSGNGVAALDLLALAERTHQDVYRRRAEDALRAAAPELDRHPAALATFALAAGAAQDGGGGE